MGRPMKFSVSQNECPNEFYLESFIRLRRPSVNDPWFPKLGDTKPPPNNTSLSLQGSTASLPAAVKLEVW